MDRGLLVLILFALCNTPGCEPRGTKSTPRSSDCVYQYEVEPWLNPATPSPTSASPCGIAGANVSIKCTVRAGYNHSFGITWHRFSGDPKALLDLIQTESASSASISGSFHDRYSMRVYPHGRTTIKTSVFTIQDFAKDEVDYGYYWCRVSSNEMSYSTPSRVILIAEPCNAGTLPQCNSPVDLFTQSMNGSCAENQFQLSNTDIPTAPLCNEPIFTTHYNPQTSLEITHSPITSSYHALLSSPPGSSSQQSEDDIERYKWLFIGLAAAVLVVISAVLLVLIVCVACRRTVVIVQGTSPDTEMETVLTEKCDSELRKSVNEEGHQQEGRDKRMTSRVHVYTEIPSFLEEADMAVYQNVQESSKPGAYDDVLPDLSRGNCRHSYDRVLDNSSPGYLRLNHQGSVRSQASLQNSLRLQLSTDSAAGVTDRQKQAVAVETMTEGSHHRINIYGEELTENDYHELEGPVAMETHHQEPPARPRADTDSDYSQLNHRTTAAAVQEQEQEKGVPEPPEDTEYGSLYNSLQPSAHPKQNIQLNRGSALEVSQNRLEETSQETSQEELDSLYSQPSSDCEEAVSKHCDVHGTPQDDTTKTMNCSEHGERAGDESATDADVRCESLDSQKGLDQDLYTTIPTGSVHPYHQLLPPSGIKDDGNNGQSVLNSPHDMSQARHNVYSHLELEYPMHNYSSVIPSTQTGNSQYSVPIISSSELYQSENGHIYHVLEN